MTVQFTHNGYLVVPCALAEQYFPFDALLALRRGSELHLLPVTTGQASGGLMYKRRNAAGDRSVLIWEALGESAENMGIQGERSAIWDAGLGALRIQLEPL